MQKDIRLPKSLIVTAKSNENVPGLIVDETGSVSLIRWINSMISEGDIVVSANSMDAADVTFTPTGNTTSENVQLALEEIQTEIDGISTDSLNFVFTAVDGQEIRSGNYSFEPTTGQITSSSDPAYTFTLDYSYSNGADGKSVTLKNRVGANSGTIPVVNSSITTGTTSNKMTTLDSIQQEVFIAEDSTTGQVLSSITITTKYMPFVGISTGSINASGSGGAGTFDVESLSIVWREIPIKALPFDITVNNNQSQPVQTVTVNSIDGQQNLNNYTSITDGSTLTLSFDPVTVSMSNGIDFQVTLPVRSYTDA